MVTQLVVHLLVNLKIQDREGRGQVDGRRGLAHAALLVRYGDDFSHIPSVDDATTASNLQI